MGVPAFFRWLTRKYPSVIVHCVEEKPVSVSGQRIPIDSSQPNPNGVEFDNLYLDMNGIIHPCTHPEDKPAPRNEDEMMVAIFEAIDRLFAIVRPRKLLYMAIDGVAPRAKMNQQRSRRFRASKEVVEKVNEISRVRAELLLKGIHLPPEKAKEDHFDSNCITPGTPFMDRLSTCLHYYVHDRLNNDPGWKGIKVILSDANVPGEGEHKIMDFIRKQRAQPDHDPNTHHCLCGADADLIMLGLATHEVNFTIIREEFKPNKPRPCEICGQTGHTLQECTGSLANADPESIAIGSEVEFIFVRLNVLREYLERELAMQNLSFDYNFERALDDWVFMCFFVGNDFLPHLPSLEIREGAIDRLVGLYKDCIYKTGGYVTNNGDVNLERVQIIMLELGKVEDQIFKKRQENELSFKAREKAKKRRMEGFNRSAPDWRLVKDTQFAPSLLGQVQPVRNPRQEAYNIRKAGMHFVPAQDQGNSRQSQSQQSNQADERRGVKRAREEDDDDDQAHDEVRLWEDGFKDRYYESKFDVGPDDLEFRYNVALQYVKGLCWVLRYYYQGCASWKWYFPYHYAPFSSDFINISGLSTQFELGTEPFKPFEQLMSVFPAASRQHVPSPWAELMTDPNSIIIDFYPEDFKIDLNGKKFAWMGVALLPFIDEDRLLRAVAPKYKLLTDEERRRNVRGDDRLYIGRCNKSYSFVKDFVKSGNDTIESGITFDGMQGTILFSNNCVQQDGSLVSPIPGLDTIENNTVCCVKYRDPKYPVGYIFQACRLKGAKPPQNVLKPQDLDAEASRNWRPMIGMAPSTVRATIGNVGHRMLNHHVPKPPGAYGNVPPPNYDRQGNNRGGYNNRNRYESGNNYQQRGSGYSGGNRNSGFGGSNYQNYNNYNQRGGNHRQNNYNNNNRNDDRRQDRPPGPYRDQYVSSNRYNYSR
uniref:5'-3' exoribonuclease n=1 Tax=Photinus pyralis TaxID=7054 RepID=A0A1Y1MVA7_PHOPY